DQGRWQRHWTRTGSGAAFAEGRGGTIGIESDQGTGTLVRLFLPRVCCGAVPIAAAETGSPTRRYPTRTAARECLETGSAMELMTPPRRLDRPVDHETDHVLGPADAEITLVEYGSYACLHCGAANERIAQARDQLGDRVRYAFRHRPLTDNSLAFRAA